MLKWASTFNMVWKELFIYIDAFCLHSYPYVLLARIPPIGAAWLMTLTYNTGWYRSWDLPFISVLVPGGHLYLNLDIILVKKNSRN